ncbi:nucleotidyl transferase AbiEii/AbiGii toxin family protein [Ferrimonas sp. SCSIO 43195]|uniref:nucleotidyl transferase AbiEii/AbiGii toxin family protein n=1 Tax=Ferrimonas sp. SCSIO 43195 TaxID=2822844 RepID=UPI002075FA0E|nr:nucleotidyl transferase AbiEii/AbiGii toxin family protein [Ferrimonas sp. SCSIO 43195]USD35989.1 nucleotidyl transferase AbiEii/AbiGii toxin family protein [Ferrimonas sp. SCSIO 43195]
MSILDLYRSDEGRTQLSELLVFAEQNHPDGLTAPFLEKDLWVTELLNILFGPEGLLGGTRVAFKGGTALSKRWRAIERFSEDIDLSVHWFELCPDDLEEEEVWEATTRSGAQIKRFRKEQGPRLEEWSKDLVQRLAERLSEYDIADLRAELLPDSGGGKVQVHFPAVAALEGHYQLDYVLLEFGARNRGEPTAPSELNTYMSEVEELSAQMVFPVADGVKVFDEGYIIWEKLTALHQFCTQERIPDAARLARHWYDVDCLIQKGIVDPLEHPKAMNDVIEMKSCRWAAKGVDYTLASKGEILLVPQGELLDSLRQDQTEMVDAGMYTNAPDDFDKIMERVAALQERINQAHTPTQD